jgi:hypothetical protein
MTTEGTNRPAITRFDQNHVRDMAAYLLGALPVVWLDERLYILVATGDGAEGRERALRLHGACALPSAIWSRRAARGCPARWFFIVSPPGQPETPAALADRLVADGFWHTAEVMYCYRDLGRGRGYRFYQSDRVDHLEAGGVAVHYTPHRDDTPQAVDVHRAEDMATCPWQPTEADARRVFCSALEKRARELEETAAALRKLAARADEDAGTAAWALLRTVTDAPAGGPLRRPVQEPERVARPEPVGCRAGRDGDCYWTKCPQLRDGEPRKSGRSCPRWTSQPDAEA